MTFGTIERSFFAALAFCALGLPGTAAQAPAGPLPQVPSSDPAPPPPRPKARIDLPRTRNLAGAWKFNVEESDDPRKKMAQYGRGGRSGGRGGGGYGGRPRYGGRAGMSDEDRQKLRDLLVPPPSLRITQQGADIHVVDDRDRLRVLVTDGRKLEKSKDPAHQEVRASWDDYRLVAEEKGPQGNRVTRAYEVLEGNRQLVLALGFAYGPRKTSVYLRFVYDLNPGENAGALPPEPSRPR